MKRTDEIEVVQFRSKPRPPGNGIRAARFDGTTKSMIALLRVALMADDDATVTSVPALDVAVVRWLEVPDHHPATQRYEVVERGKWLAFSDNTWSLYETDDADLNQWYEQVEVSP